MHIREGNVEIVDVVRHQPLDAHLTSSSWIVGIESRACRTVENQLEGSDASFQVGQNRGVNCLGLRLRMLLAEVPAGGRGTQRREATHKRSLTGQPGGIAFAKPIGLRVDRLQVDAFVGVRDELLFERRSLERIID